MSKDDLRKYINQAIRKIPIFSAQAIQLLKLTSDPDHSLADVINIVKRDMGLTAVILKTVNSAAFFRHAKITTVDRAVAQLGEAVVTGFAVMEASSRQLNANLTGYDGRKGDLWRHSLKTAIAAKCIAPLGREVINEGTAYTCGLLHDIGKSLTSNFLEGTAEKIAAGINQQQFEEYCAAEKDFLGLDHAEAGHMLASHWQLPPPLPAMIKFHHTPGEAEEADRGLAYAVHLADIMAMMSGTGTGADSLQYRLDSNYQKFLKIDENSIPQLLLDIDEEYSNLLAALGG